MTERTIVWDDSRIDHVVPRLGAMRLILVMHDCASSVLMTLLPALRAEIELIKRPAAPYCLVGVEDRPTVLRKSGATSDVGQTRFGYAKPWLTDGNNVGAYVQKMKKSPIAEIRSGQRVIV
jgi:hypothetical protein